MKCLNHKAEGWQTLASYHVLPGASNKFYSFGGCAKVMCLISNSKVLIYTDYGLHIRSYRYSRKVWLLLSLLLLLLLLL